MTRLALLTALFWAACPFEAMAGQHSCLARADIARNLETRYGETHQFTLMARDSTLEFFMNDASVTWTIIRTTADGVSCVVASGTGVIAGRMSPTGVPG